MNARFLLQQDHVWRDGAGRYHVLEEMDPDSRANLIPFLRGNAVTYAALCGADARTPAEAEAWIDGTPLVRRLKDLENERTTEAATR